MRDFSSSIIEIRGVKHCMPIKYCYDGKTNLLTATASGTLKVDEFEEYLKSVKNDPKIKSGFIEIFLYSGVDDFDFRFKSGKLISHHYSDLMESKMINVSIHYSTDNLHMGISHLLSALLENVLKVKIAKTAEELQFWINSFR